MIDCISVQTMRESDAYTIEHFVPSLTLMYRAAYGVYLAHSWQGRTAIVVGSGNNGGDGFALACILTAHGHDCVIYTLSERLSPDSAYYAERAKNAGVPITCFSTGCLSGYDTVVDCLLGTGFQGAVRDNYRRAIEAINAADSFVISVDINSGMNGDTGAAELAVRSDLTVTIGYVKTGLVSENAGRYMKRLVCADIGIILTQREALICTEAELPAPESMPHFLCPPWLDLNVIRAVDIVPAI